MGDIWNPFDANNPVYKKLAKETRIQRSRVRNTVLVIAGLAITYAISQQTVGDGIFGGPVNQFGMVRRK